MSRTYSKLLIHAIFATSRRRPLICEAFEPGLYATFAAITNASYGRLIVANGTSDHVHLLADLKLTACVSDLVRDLKTGSTRWVRRNVPDRSAFAWQKGYSCFSIGHSQRNKVHQYITRQKAHHAYRSFEAEHQSLIDRLKEKNRTPDTPRQYTARGPTIQRPDPKGRGRRR